MGPMVSSAPFYGGFEPWVSVLILGAGRGQRMGLQKLLLPWGNQTILEATVTAYTQSAAKEVIVVLGRDMPVLRSLLEPYQVKLAFNPNYSTGMASSIKAGLRCLDPRANGIMIALGDMPLVSPPVINRVVSAFGQGHEIVVPVWGGKRGHPVLFHRRYQGELMVLSGDQGGRSLLERYPERVFEVEVDTPAILMDIDTMEDYERLIAYAWSSGSLYKGPGA